ncbi:MAG: hypothetical protein JWN63_2601 [Candidatus Acidoferrum typicum]|jgi:hypothetical protein|nr:hypothetical protein [Candidatus Acidoferrum typicum]
MKAQANRQKYVNAEWPDCMKDYDTSAVLDIKTHRKAVNYLIKCLKADPSQEKSIEAFGATLTRYWPNILKMSSKKQFPVSFELMDIINEAREAVIPTESDHQKAIDAEIETLASTYIPENVTN